MNPLSLPPLQMAKRNAPIVTNVSPMGDSFKVITWKVRGNDGEEYHVQAKTPRQSVVMSMNNVAVRCDCHKSSPTSLCGHAVDCLRSVAMNHSQYVAIHPPLPFQQRNYRFSMPPSKSLKLTQRGQDMIRKASPREDLSENRHHCTRCDQNFDTCTFKTQRCVIPHAVECVESHKLENSSSSFKHHCSLCERSWIDSSEKYVKGVSKESGCCFEGQHTENEDDE